MLLNCIFPLLSYSQFSLKTNIYKFNGFMKIRYEHDHDEVSGRETILLMLKNLHYVHWLEVAACINFGTKLPSLFLFFSFILYLKLLCLLDFYFIFYFIFILFIFIFFKKKNQNLDMPAVCLIRTFVFLLI